MEPEEQHDTPDVPGRPADEVYDPPVPHDRPTLEGGMGEPDTWISSEPDAPAPALELAEPAVYVCIAENVGEHPILGRLDFGEEYDYSNTQDERTLAAVAACVTGGYLEKV